MAQRCAEGLEFIERNIAQTERDFFGAGDPHALPFLQDLDKVAGLDQGGMRAGVEPGKAAAEHLDEQVASLHIGPVHIGNLDLAARRGFKIGCDTQNVIVVKIKTGHGDVGFRVRRLFLDRQRPPQVVELDHAILLRGVDHIAEYGRASWRAAARASCSGKPWP